MKEEGRGGEGKREMKWGLGWEERKIHNSLSFASPFQEVHLKGMFCKIIAVESKFDFSSLICISL